MTPKGGPVQNKGFDYEPLESQPHKAVTQALGVCKACKEGLDVGDYAVCARCEFRKPGSGLFCSKHKGRVKQHAYKDSTSPLCAPCRRYVERRDEADGLEPTQGAKPKKSGVKRMRRAKKRS